MGADDGIVGLDLSLTRTGIATSGGCMVITAGRKKGAERLIEIRDAVVRLCTGERLVVIEGYSFNSRQGGEHLGELGGVVRVALYEAGVEWVECPPASLKVCAAGRGNANKDEVLAAAIRRLAYAGSDHNESDALWLRTMALVRYNLPGAPVLPAVHLRNWPDAVAWPELREEAA